MTSVVGLTEILNVTVTPAPGSVQDTNLTEVAGNAVATGVGASNTGTQRVALSTDSSVNIQESPNAITGTLTDNGVLFTTETLGANTISIQLSGDWQALCTFQVSNDNTYWANVQGYTFNNYMSSTNTAQDNGVYIFPVTGRYFQVVVSNYKSGTVSAVSYLRQQSLAGIGETMLTQAMDSANNTPMNVTFQGVTQAGQSPAVNSVPVTLSNENIRDLYIASRNIGTPLAVNTVIPMDGAYPIATNPGGWIDVSQYRSLYMNMVCAGTLTGTISIEVSNDGVNLLNSPGFNFYDTQSLDLVQTGAATSGAVSLGTNKNATRVGNLGWRYLRFRVTTAVGGTGTVVVTAMLRMTLSPYGVSQTQFSSIQGNNYGASATMTSAATQAINFPPLTVGGNDRSVIRSELIGNTGAGGIANSYLTNGPYARNAYYDLAGAQGVAGPQPFLAEDKTYPVNVRLERSTNGQDSVQDLLQQVLVELKALNYYTREMPTAIATLSQSANPLSSGFSSMQDDPEALADDPTLYRYQRGH